MATLDVSSPSVGNDIFAHHGRQIILRGLHEPIYSPIPPVILDGSVPEQSGPSLAVSPEDSNKIERLITTLLQKDTSFAAIEAPTEPVGILGAGPAGLYTALILLDLGIPFKIIEARERVGGRLFTYQFPDQTGAPYNYFDVGAMRFPEITSMKRVFHLFSYKPLNEGDLALKKKLRNFYFSNDNAFLSYNGVTIRRSERVIGSNQFKSREVIQDANPDPYISAGVDCIANDVIRPFASRLIDDLNNNTTSGWEYMKSFDKYSTRAYMNIPYRPSAKLIQRFQMPNAPLPVDVVNWMETFDKSTGWYDRALTETVLEGVAFGWSPDEDPCDPPKKPVAGTKWWCIDGGSVQIANTMYQYLKSQKPDVVTFGTRVTGIKTAKNTEGKTVGVDVTTNNSKTPQRFSHVVTSIPLPVLRTVDLTQAGLTPMQSNALRQLNYGPSVKIGMQFRTAWWTTGTDKAGRQLNIVGGQSYTDSPLRTVVYPSFGDVEAGKTTTLIASYCWTEDSERLAALITNDKEALKELTLRELAVIHNLDIDFLQKQLIDTFAWSWSLDTCTMGAFAFFGPGKFVNVYKSLTLPAADNRLHFAGEAISVRHAWVEGALDSAWRAVNELLAKEPAYSHLLGKFYKNWGVNAEWTVPVGGLVPDEGEGDMDVERIMRNSLLLQHMAVHQT